MKSNDFMKPHYQALLQSDRSKADVAGTFMQQDNELLNKAHDAWNAMATYRQCRTRNRNYTYGKQWVDPISLADGRVLSEEQYLREQGKVPLKNNLIRQLVKSVIGQFRSAQTEPVCISRERKEQSLGEIMSVVMQYAYQHNRLYELDSRSLEEFLISGSCFHKIGYGNRRGKTDVWIDAVQPSRIFFNTMEDCRLWDCNLIGELHDMTLNDVIARFAGGSPQKARHLRQIFGDATDVSHYNSIDTASAQRFDSINFFVPDNSHHCRVIELWTLDSREMLRCHDTMSGQFYKVDVALAHDVEKENQRRKEEAASRGIEAAQVPVIETEWFLENYWYYRFFSPLGHILDEGESPYWHGEHPYAFRLYPMIDSEIHSFVEDVIDQQRYVNRLITMIDFIMGSSAKGVLLFPEDQIPDGMSLDDIATEWTRCNGVILFRPKPGCAMPQQIAVNATNVGAYELLSLQMRLLEDISGVHSAIQGKAVPSGTASSLYAQQVQYSAVNLLDLFESFKAFREERDTKLMKTIQQFYDENRYKLIAGDDNFDTDSITPERVRNAEFDIVIAESASAPAFRQMSNDFLLELFRSGHISLQALLETGTFPFADKLLQYVNSEQQQQMQMMAALSQQQAPGSSSPTAQPAQL